MVTPKTTSMRGLYKQGAESRLANNYRMFTAYRTLCAAMIEIGKPPKITLRGYVALQEDVDRENAYFALLKEARKAVTELERGR